MAAAAYLLACCSHAVPSFEDDWLFRRDADSVWSRVDLPHDYAIDDIPGTNSPFDSTITDGVASGYTRGDLARYRKTLHVGKKERDNTFYLLFDGVYMDSRVDINGIPAGEHLYGYTPFVLDISPFLQEGENQLEIRVSSPSTTSRWYSGAGIYRHTALLEKGPLHLAPYPLRITTQGDTLHAVASIRNKSQEDAAVQLRFAVLDTDGGKAFSGLCPLTIPPGESKDCPWDIILPDACRWSPDNPFLYTLVTEILSKEKVLDHNETSFGFRDIDFDPQRGFLLNGNVTLLKGGCIHHDNGPLGAVALDRAEERKIQILKQAGFNAIRTAHNPPSTALLDACDRLGMLVIDEAFDVWKNPHFEMDYARGFDMYWKQDIEAIIRRDINHPSVILWSSGNEIIGNETTEMAILSREITDWIHELDPTRPVTNGVNNAGIKAAFLETLDVAGYNYSRSCYQSGLAERPWQTIVSTESYPSEAFVYWQDVERYPWVIGDFVWTAWDYIGESGIGWTGYPLDKRFYPFHMAYCGDIDICGRRREQSYYRETLWSSRPTAYIAVCPPEPSFPINPDKEDWSVWDWPDEVRNYTFPGQEGVPLDIKVYTQCEEAELLLDGRSLGRKKRESDTRNKFSWTLPYQSGTLTTVCYDEGEAVARDTLRTAGPAHDIILRPDRTMLQKGGRDLCYLDIYLVDENGTLCTDYHDPVYFRIQGEGSLQAVCNGDPMNVESFHSSHRSAWRGHCQAILRSGKRAGTLAVEVQSGNMKRILRLKTE